MQKNSLRGTMLQWLAPFFILLIFLTVIVREFVLSTDKSISLLSERENTQIGTSFSKSIEGKLAAIMSMSHMLESTLEANSDSDIVLLMDTMDDITNSSDAYMVAFCWENGQALLPHNVHLNLKNAEYFELLQGTERFFAYTSDDGVAGKAALLYICPTEIEEGVKGYLITYIEPELLESVFDESPYGMDAFYVLVNRKGDIIATYGHEGGSALIVPDFWNALKPLADEPGYWSLFNSHSISGEVGVLQVTAGKEKRTLYSFPINNTEWSLVVCLDKVYVQNYVNNIWKPVEKLLLRAGVLIITFLIVTIGINITVRMRSNEQSRKLKIEADSDMLTELSNKMATERKIRKYMKENPQSQSVMFILDVDYFKKINDSMGHAFGDEVLRSLGLQLKTMFRSTDIIGRVGGDEFIIFLKDIKDKEVIEREGKKMEQFFQEFKVGEYVKYSVTVSVGGAVFPTDGDSFEDLYKAADEALYESKRNGRSQISFYKKKEK